MISEETAAQPPLLLGVEGGGTRTVALLADGQGKLLQRMELGPANLRLLSDQQLQRHLRNLAKEFPKPTAIGIGLAGMRTESDRARVDAAITKVWGTLPRWISNDLETALAAAGGNRHAGAQVLVLSGTGSCCFGKRSDGQTSKVGGWGHLLGDEGSGFDIAMRALRAVIVEFDHTGRWPGLGERFLNELLLNAPDDLIAWLNQAPKNEVARLTPVVFSAGQSGDRIATTAVHSAAQALVRDALACARRLCGSKAATRFVFAGSVLLRQQKFAARVQAALHRERPTSTFAPLPRESAWGAVELAKAALTDCEDLPASSGSRAKATRASGQLRLPIPTKLSPTEERNPRSLRLDHLPLRDAVRLMIKEDRCLPAALLHEERAISRAISLIVQALRNGGRLFYVGAGTSGRLGVLDASECPPTFRTRPELVQGIIAGGTTALWQSIEGAEDDGPAGARAVEYRGVSRRDLVVGIAASGRTPFVWGALNAAKQRDARTVFICFNPHLRYPRDARPQVVIAPNIGPEILTGSTRLKAGTATKMILNLFTTLAMVQLGKVVSNLMVDMNPSNSKLRDRAIRIVRQLTESDEIVARKALVQTGWVVKEALNQLVRTAGCRSDTPRRRNARARRAARR